MILESGGSHATFMNITAEADSKRRTLWRSSHSAWTRRWQHIALFAEVAFFFQRLARPSGDPGASDVDRAQHERLQTHLNFSVWIILS